ncbi:cytochrome P450 [Haloplanus sp. GCM10025708]|uniref:cytochrome P450 n=1 Tax=Haloplanus sp. GCM10025708 TaxID=3252679 RepID=UPI00360611D8
MAGDGRRGDAENAPPLPPYPSTVGHPLTHSFRTMRDVFGFRDRALANHDVVRVRLFGPGDVYHFAHPDHFDRVLVSDREQFRKSEDFRIAFGRGLVAAEGGEWRRQREVLQPLFRRERLRSHADTIVEQVRRRRRRWDDGERIDLPAETSQLSLDVLFATLFGRELALDGDEDVREAAGRLSDWFTPTSYPLPNWVPTPARRRFEAGRRRLRAVADRLLAEKAANPRRRPPTPTTSSRCSSPSGSRVRESATPSATTASATRS